MIPVDFKQRVTTLINSNECEQKSRAWVTAAFAALQAADDLKYECDSFHNLSLEKQKATLLTLVSRGLLAIDTSSRDKPEQDDLVVWLRGFYFNDVLIRMAALVERGLENLWEKFDSEQRFRDIVTDNKGRYLYWRLKTWYEAVFGEDIEDVSKVRKQVNIFKHHPRISGLKVVDEMGEAILAFTEVLGILEKTITTNTNFTKEAHNRWCEEVTVKKNKKKLENGTVVLFIKCLQQTANMVQKTNKQIPTIRDFFCTKNR